MSEEKTTFGLPDKERKIPGWGDLVGEYLCVHLQNSSHRGRVLSHDEDAGAIEFEYPVYSIEEDGGTYRLGRGVFSTNFIAGWFRIPAEEVERQIRHGVQYRDLLGKRVRVYAKSCPPFEGRASFVSTGSIMLDGGKHQISAQEIVAVSEIEKESTPQSSP